MKRVLTLILLILSSAVVRAQMMPDSTVQTVAYWFIGDKYSYQLEESKVNVMNDTDTVLVEKSAQILTFEVIDSTAAGYRIRVTSLDDQHSDYGRMELNRKLEKLMGDIPVEFETDPNGTFLQISPVTFTQKEKDKMLDVALDHYKKEKNLSNKELKELRGLVSALLTPEYLTNATLNLISPLLFFHGTRLEIDKHYPFDTEIQPLSAVSDKMLEMKGEFWADGEWTDEKSVILHCIQSIDEEQLKPFIASVISTFSKDAGWIDEATNGLQMRLCDLITEEVHLPTGWPIYYAYDRHIIVTDGEKTQEQIISRSFLILDTD